MFQHIEYQSKLKKVLRGYVKLMCEEVVIQDRMRTASGRATGVKGN